MLAQIKMGTLYGFFSHQKKVLTSGEGNYLGIQLMLE